MKISYFLPGIVMIALAGSCDKFNSKSELRVTKFEIVPETTRVPAKVFLIWEYTVKNSAEVEIYHQGAVKSFEEDQANDYSKMIIGGNHSRLDTMVFYYLDAGKYKIRLEIVGGAMFEDNFTLLEPEE